MKLVLNRKLVVHIVDDDALSATLLEDYLKKKIDHNLEVFKFETGEDCLIKIAQSIPDIVILDYHLDSKAKYAANGMEILKRIMSYHPEVYVIMLSGQAKIDIAVETMRIGAKDYVIKGETASLHVYQIIYGMIESENQEAQIKQYKIGFWLASSVVALITLGTLILYFFFPEHTKHMPL